MKRLTSLFVVIALGLFVGLNALTITVGGSGETVNYFPIYTWYGYNYTQQIYTQAQINYQGPISKIRFYRASGGAFDNCHDWVIYMGNTTRTSFSSTSDWEPVANLTQVFSGSVLNNFPGPGQWMEITLDTPFTYNNTSNLLVAIHENTPSYSSSVRWGGFTSDSSVGMYYYNDQNDPDVNNPPNANSVVNRIASIQLVFPDTAAPMAPELVFPENGASIMNGQTLRWTLPHGSSDASGYDVYIDGTMVSENQNSTQYTITGLANGAHTWYVVARNNIGTSPPSATGNFNITSGVIIGNGTDNNRLPVNPFYGYNYTQSIFLQSEINLSNQRIERISYYWNGAGVGTNTSDWVVYMGHVQRSEFTESTDWVPVGDLVQVFNGHLNIPAEAGWIEIELDLPFTYNNTDNLLIAVDENTPNYDGSGQYFHSTSTGGVNRSIRYYSDGNNPDPNSPPNGTLVAAYPNIMMQFGELPTAPVLRLSPPALNFGEVMYDDSSSPLTVTATNIGSGTLNLSASDFSIVGDDADQFSLDLVNLPAALQPGQNVQISVTVRGTTEGQITATLRAVHNGENHDVALAANVLAPGVVLIGNGTAHNMLPVNAFYGYSYTQSIFLQSEINLSNQRIERISYYWNGAGVGTNTSDWVIYMGHVQRNEFGNNTDWVPVGELIQVFEGHLNIPAEAGWIEIELDMPFTYNNTDNLLIAVDENTPSYDGSGRFFYTTPTPDVNRSIRFYSDGTNPDPIEPPTGTLVAAYPNILIQFGDLPTTPVLRLSPAALNFGLVMYGEPASPLTVMATNTGSGTLNLSAGDFSFIGTHADQFSLDDTNLPAALTPGQYVYIPVTVTGTTAGEITATLRVVYDGQNHDVALTADVLPAGTVIIGDGIQTQRQPFGTTWGYERSAALYTVDQIGLVGAITMVGWDCANTTNTPIPYKIWAKNTNETTLTAQTWQDFTNGATMLKEGTFTPNTLGWNIFQFDTPFAYNGASLIIAVESNYGGGGGGSGHTFKYTSALGQMHQFWYQDSSEPTESGSTNANLPNIMMHISSDIEDDIGALSLTGNLTPTVGIETSYTVRLRNNGSNAQDTYQVKLMGANDTELAVVNGPPINSGMTAEVEISWTPTVAGPAAIYGKVEMVGDELAQNNQTNVLDLNIQPEGVQAVTIGAGNEIARIPMDFWMRNSLYQTLYMSDEIGFTQGTITSLALYNQFAVAPGNGATQIYLGSTNRTDLTEGYISANDLTLVYDGNVDYPAGNNTILINLQTPYMHLGGNLVMMFYRVDGAYYSPSNYFKCQTVGNNRARNAISDGAPYDPQNPPAGTLTGQFPQVTFFYTGDMIENDLAALSIIGNSSPTVGVSSTYTVRVKNTGTESQDTYTVKLMGADNVELASVAGPAINSQQILEVEVPWSPTIQGSMSIYGKVEMTGDQIPTNNTTRPFNLMVNPAGVFAVTVGEGTENARIPVDMWWKNSLFQTLYFPDELGGFIGQITGLKFYNNFNSNLVGLPISIWLGTTTQTNLADGYIPSTQLTLVHEGPVDFPSGENTISIVFSEPYMYLDGGNLVLMVHRTDTSYYSSSDYFKAQTVGSDRSRNVFADSETYDPANPPAGSLSGQFPMTTFMVIPGGVGHISGTVTGANNQPLSGVSVTLNNGTYSTTTNAAGQYQLINVLPETYTLAFNAHGYYEHTQTVVLEEDDELTIDVTLQLLPQVSVTGTVLASDTGVGISGALIQLAGYEPYSTNTNAAGAFTIPNVFADHTYDYNISAAGYSSQNGQVVIGTTNHNMGEITLSEVAYAPVSVTAEVNTVGDIVNVTWLAPDPNALEIVESFEGAEFPPDGWTQTITNSGPPNALGLYPTWCRVGALTVQGDNITPTEGEYQAGFYWDYNHQDEWLITPPFNCPPNAYLSFDSYVFLGSDAGDHYYVKVSTDNGSSWTVLWDASAQTGGWNEYSSPITVDLGAYTGNQIKIAFHAIDGPEYSGLYYFWFIDNVYIGNSTAKVHFDLDEMSVVSASRPELQRQAFGTAPIRARSRLVEEGAASRVEPRLPRPNELGFTRHNPRVLTGYTVYRLEVGQEQNEASWVLLTDEAISDLSFADTGWDPLPNGDYRWAVKAIYTNGVTSVASFSNILNKDIAMGMIVGTVRRQNNTGIIGATVTNGTVSTTTNTIGAYTLLVRVGYHNVTAIAAGFDTLTVENVLVSQGENTTVNFVMTQTDSDDPVIPVLATTLNGNFPNPFNPETTVSYSIKEPGRVKLEVYNIKGQLVRTLVDEEQITGHYKMIFDAKDDRGRSISSGVYLLKMVAPGYRKTSKMILMQ